MPPKKAKAATPKWAYQGVQCYVSKAKRPDHTLLRLAPREPNKRHRRCWVATHSLSGHVPLYRLHHQSRNDYCYCASIESLEAARKEGYGNPQCLGYVMITQDAQHVPLMRTFNPETSRYYHTTRVKEVDACAPFITGDDLEDDVGKIFGVKPKTFDNHYFCPTRRAAEQVIQNSRVPGKEYSDTAMDCDDYAHLLKSAFIEDAYNIYDLESALAPRRSTPYALGVVCGFSPRDKRRHSMNILLTSDGRVDDYEFWLVEPQTGELLPLPKYRRRLTGIEFLFF